MTDSRRAHGYFGDENSVLEPIRGTENPFVPLSFLSRIWLPRFLHLLPSLLVLLNRPLRCRYLFLSSLVLYHCHFRCLLCLNLIWRVLLLKSRQSRRLSRVFSRRSCFNSRRSRFFHRWAFGCCRPRLS